MTFDWCPQGCGRTTDDPYGGPCTACWDAVSPRPPDDCDCVEFLCDCATDREASDA